jgi:hypothetical protein
MGVNLRAGEKPLTGRARCLSDIALSKRGSCGRVGRSRIPARRERVLEANGVFSFC